VPGLRIAPTLHIYMPVSTLGYGLDDWGSTPGMGDDAFISSPPRPDRLWGSRSKLLNGYRMWSGRVVKLTTHLHLVQRLRMFGAIPPFPNTSS